MYDLIIIGAGAAGLTSSIYASCFKLNHLVIGKDLGGQMLLAPDILNYPGFENITGKELTEKMASQAKNLGGEIVSEFISKIEKKEDSFNAISDNGKNYEAKSIILATGTERRKLNIPGEVEYTGKGVYYSSVIEANEVLNKTVGVVGGGNSAVVSALGLSSLAAKVFLIYRGSELRADPMRIEQMKANPKIEVLYNSQVSQISGDGQKLTGIKVKNQEEEKEIPIEKLIIEIGGVPGTALVIPLGVAIDEKGFIKVNENLETNIPGVFAAGDIVSSGLSIEQVSTAVGLGARAATSAYTYLKKEKAPILWGQSQIKR